MAQATGTISIAQSNLSRPFSAFTYCQFFSRQQALTYHFSIFVHARDTADRQALIPGSKVSFIYEADEKGGKAKEVTVEEMADSAGLDQGSREMGTVKVSFTV